ncbi:MAG TPA: ATP-binding protein [Clostridia bacterium]
MLSTDNINFFFSVFEGYGYLIELIIANALFATSFKKRKLFVLRVAASFLLMVLIYAARNELLPKNLYVEIIIHFLLFVCVIFCIVFCFKTNLLTALFCGIGAFATQHWGFKLGSVFQILVKDANVPYLSYILYVFGIALVYLAAYFIFAKRLREGIAQNINNISVLLLSVSLVIIMIFLQLIISGYKNIDSKILLTLNIYGMLSCIFILCIQYDIFKRGKMEEEQEILKHILYQQKEQMELSKSNIELINVKCHDLKHQLLRYKEKLDSSEIAALEKMISIYDSVLRTGNEALDVILTEKSLLFEKHKIKLDCIADGKCLDFMSPSDIYSLFGNALDNAFEAAHLIQDVEKRMIGIYIKESKGFVSIHIRNYFQGEITFENGLPVTTKQDVRFHGFGTKSIKMIVEKYKGVLSFNVEGDIFNLNILIPVQA